MKQTNSLSSKDENMSSENGAAGLTQDQLLFTENIYASLPMSIEVYDANGVLRKINDKALKMPTMIRSTTTPPTGLLLSKNLKVSYTLTTALPISMPSNLCCQAKTKPLTSLAACKQNTMKPGNIAMSSAFLSNRTRMETPYASPASDRISPSSTA